MDCTGEIARFVENLTLIMEKKGAKIHILTNQEIKKEWIPLCKPAFDNFSKRFPEAYKEAMALKAKYEK